MPYKLVEVVFGNAGSLGMVLVSGRGGETIVKDTEGQARAAVPKICRGDVVARVGDVNVGKMSHSHVLAHLRKARRPLTVTFSREVHGLGVSPGSWSTNAVLKVEKAEEKSVPKASTSRFHFGKNKVPPPQAKKAAGGLGWGRRDVPPPPPKHRGGIYMGHAHARSASAASGLVPPGPPPRNKGMLFKSKTTSSSSILSKKTVPGPPPRNKTRIAGGARAAKAKAHERSSSSVAARIAAFSGNKTTSSPALRKTKPVFKAKKWPPAHTKNAASFSYGSSSSGSADSSSVRNLSANGVVVSEPNSTAGLRSVKKSAVARVEERQQSSRSSTIRKSEKRSNGSYNTVWQKQTIKVAEVKKPPPPVPTRHVFYEAMYDFVAEHADELGFHEGDKIRFLAKVGDGEWLKGYANGREGIFPASYAQRVAGTAQRRTSWVASGP